MKKTRQLIACLVAIAISFTMLLGTTFAWFTDSVANTNTIIKAGKVDVELWHTNMVDGVGHNDVKCEEVKSDTKLFLNKEGKNVLWEPGAKAGETFRIKNVGTLALKYEFRVVALNKSFTADGKALSDILDLEVLEISYNDMGAVDSSASALIYYDKFDDGYVVEGELLPGETKDYLVGISWKPSANDNDYNVKGGLFLKLGIELVATQYNYEVDGNGSDYDKNAELIPVAVTIDESASTEDVVSLMNEGKSLRIKGDVSLTPKTRASKLEIDTVGEIHILYEEGARLLLPETTIFRGEGTIIVHQGTIEADKELCVSGNTSVIFNGGVHSFDAFSMTSNGEVVINGGTFNFNGTYAGIMGITFGENGKLVVNDGNINLYEPINLNPNRCDNAKVEINGGRFELLNGIENLFVVRNIMDKDRVSGVLRGSSIRIYGGTFIANYPVDSAGDATSFIRNGDDVSDTNRVLTSNVFNGNNDYDCLVYGGKFYGSWQRADNTRYVDGNYGYSDGLFVENSIIGFVAEGYEMTGNADSGYVVTKK